MAIKECCEASIAKDAWAHSGYRKSGDKWICPECGAVYVHDCDEATGCCWLPANAHKIMLADTIKA
jgi:hypothetical protein